MNINPRELDQRVTFKQRKDGQDAAGQPIEEWDPVTTIGDDGTMWAAIKAVSGKEFLAAQAGQSQVQTKIITRFFEGATSAMRIDHGSTIYNIEAPLPVGRKWIIFMCTSGTNING